MTVVDMKLTAKLLSGIQNLLPPSDFLFIHFSRQKVISTSCWIINSIWDPIIRFHVSSILSLITNDKDIAIGIQL